jgi:membrane protein
MDSEHTGQDRSESPADEARGDPRRVGRRAALANTGQLAAAFWRKLGDDDVTLHATSLTYTTILSMVPLLAVVFSMLKAFGVHNQVGPILARWLAPLGPEGVALSERIIEFVHRMQVGVLGAVGIAGLIYTVVMLVAAIEDALNRIWQARQGRAWSSKFRNYLSVITVGPVLVFSALALTASAQQYEVVQRAVAYAPWLLWTGTVILPYVILSTAFTLLYRFMPNTYVTWIAAVLGGIAAGVGWNLAGAAFTAFVASSGRYAAIYSSFAILILFFLWVYLSWLIVLIGAEVAYLWQYPADVLHDRASDRAVDRELNGLAVLVFLTRQHLDGAAPTPLWILARGTGIPPSIVADIADQMVTGGVLLEAERPRGFALARPPESVPVYEILRLMHGVQNADRAVSESVAHALETREAAVQSALNGVTLKSLATNTPPDGNANSAGNPDTARTPRA